MEGLGTETLAFLVDIQERGANQLKALSADFAALGDTADRISARLTALQAQLARTAQSAETTGAKMSATSKGQTDATRLQAAETAKLSKAQVEQTGSTDKVLLSTKRLEDEQRKQTATQMQLIKATQEQTKATQASTAEMTKMQQTLPQTGRHLDEHHSRLRKISQATGKLASDTAAMSYPLLGVALVAGKMSMDFEAAMERLHGQAGYTQKQVEQLMGQVTKLSPSLARTPNELAEALYHVASVGIPASESLKLMRAAAEGANVGNASLEETTNGLAIVLKNLHQPASSAKEDMALLNEIVGVGNLHMEELVSVLGKVLPGAKNFGLGLRDAGAALDVLTSRGIPANRAATALNQTFFRLGDPKSTAVKALDEIGLKANTLAEDMRKPNGLLLAFESLKEHLDKTFPPGAHKLSIEEENRALKKYAETLKEAGVEGKKLEDETLKYKDALEHMGSAAVQQSQVLSNIFGGGRFAAGGLTLVQNIEDLRKSYQRIPEGTAALKRMQDATEQWEKTSASHFDHAKATVEASMTEIGKSIDTQALPVLAELAKVVAHGISAFEKLPGPIKTGTEALIIMGAVASPVLKTISGITKIAADAGAMIGRFRGGGATPGGVVPQVAGAPEQLAASTIGRVSGFIGPELPGSRINPIAVVVMGGGLGGAPGGLGGPGAEVTAAERRSPGGVILPPGVSAEAVAAEERAAPSLFSRLLGGGRAMLGRLPEAGLIGFGGLAAAQLAGAVIPGKAGEAIGHIGSYAATGAALGSLAGPEGTVIGGVGGAAIGALTEFIHKGESRGAELADKIGKGIHASPAIVNAMKGAEEKGAEEGVKAEAKARMEAEAHNRQLTQKQAAEVRYKAERPYDEKAGEAAALAMIEGFQKAKFVQEPAIAHEMIAQLEKAHGGLKQAAAKQMIAYAASLEEQGKLPKGATDKLISELEEKWPHLAEFLKEQGESSVKEYAKTLEGKEAIEAAHKFIGTINQEWDNGMSALGQSLIATRSSLSAQWVATWEFLENEAHHGSGAMKKRAEKGLEEMAQNTPKLVGPWAHKLVSEFEKGGIKSVEQLEKGLDGITKAINTTGGKGNKAAETQLAELVKKYQDALKHLGVPVQAAAHVAGQVIAGEKKLFAGGGRVPGPVGPDNVGVYGAGGGLRAVVAGGELLVANRHTESRVDRMLAPYGTTLGAEVAGEKVPHAAPGFQLGGSTGGSHLTRLISTMNAVAGMHFPYHWGGGHEQPAHLEPFDCSGAVSYAVQRAGYNVPTTVSGSIAGWGFPGGPGEATIFYNPRHTFMRVGDRYWGTSSQNPGGGAGWIGAAPDPAYLAEFSTVHLPGLGGTSAIAGAESIAPAPYKGPGGLIGAVARGTAARATRVANAILSRVSSAVMGGLPNTGQFVGDLVPGIMGIEARAAQIAGLPFDAMIVGALLSHESSGGVNEPPSGPLGATGPNQVIPSTFASYALPGHTNIANPLDNAIASFRYIKSRYGSLGGMASSTGLLSGTYKGYAYGGRMAGGGVITADKPTMAMFGEGGRETAFFVPHAQEGALLRELGVETTFAEPHHRPHIEHPVEGLNPDNNQIETHTPAEWRSIRLRHEQYMHAHPRARTRAHHPHIEIPHEGLNPTNNRIETRTTAEWRGIRLRHEQQVRTEKARPAVEEQIQLGGAPVGDIVSKQAAPIDLGGDVGKLAANVWPKVMHAVEQFIKLQGPSGAALTAQRISADHEPRMRELAGHAVALAGKTVMTGFKEMAPAEMAGGGLTDTLGLFRRLIKDARVSGHRELVRGLHHDMEEAVKASESAIVKIAGEAPPGDAIAADRAGITKLQHLIGTAHRNHLKALENGMIKNMMGLVGKMDKDITSHISTMTQRLEDRQQIGIIGVKLGEMREGRVPGGKKLADAERAGMEERQDLVERQTRELEGTKGTLTGLLAQAKRKHEHKLAHAIEEQLTTLDDEIEKSKLDAAKIALEMQEAVEQAMMKTVEDITSEFGHREGMTTLAGKITAQQLHNAGQDISTLKEKQSEQGGVLTPQQVQQAQTDLRTFTAQANQEIAEREQERAALIGAEPGLTGPARTKAEEEAAQLTLAIEELKGSIIDQTKSTNELTKANQNVNTTMAQFTGAVTFSYQSQQYTVGQTSEPFLAPGVGG